MAHYQACERVPVKKVLSLLPARYIEALEQNQQIQSCCRHPENHEIEAKYSNETQRDLGIPDIYIMHCTCGRKHTRFCVGAVDEGRPWWEFR